MDWPDLKPVFAAKAALHVPDTGDWALHAKAPDLPAQQQERAQALRELLRAAIPCCRPTVWSADTLSRMRNSVTVAEAVQVELTSEVLSKGMATDCELWWADGGVFVAETASGDPVTLESLLLVRLSASVPRSAWLPAENGLFVCVLVKGTPQLVLWWEGAQPLRALLEQVAVAIGGVEPSAPLVALGFWAGVGLLARARGIITAAEVSDGTGSAWLLGDPAEWALVRGEAVH